jgi:TP901 family phage tail tape measure protein
MAEDQIVTRIVATADFSNLIVDLNKVSSALTNLQTKLNATNKNLSAQAAVMNRSFAETMRSTGQFSTHFVNLQSDVEKFGSQLDKGQIKLRQFFQVYQGHVKTNSGIVRQLAAQQVQLQNAILQPLGKNSEGLMQYNVHIPTGLDKVKNRTALARQELQIMNRVIQEGANSLINWGKNTQWAGRQLTVGLTIPLAAFGKASADAFRTADQELTRLTKVYGGLTAKSSLELAKIRADVSATASELAKGYGASFKETLGLAADIAATGKEGDDLLGSIKETTRLAVLGEVDRQDAMKATLAIQSAFKQNTDELAESINFLNAVENQTSTTLGDLVEAIPKAGPVIKGLGGSVQDLALYLTAMREGGINATEGANALKSALASLINPTDVAIAKFADFGINLKAIVNDNAGNVTDTLLALQEGLDNLNPLQKSQAIEQLFGKFQFSRISALFENLGKQGSQTLEVMDLMKASSQDLANIAGRELSMVTESASGRYRRALEGLKAELAGVGEQFLTINTHLINIVSGILKFIDKLPAPLKSLLAFFGGLTAVAGPLIMLTGVLANFFGYIIKGASQFRALFKGGAGWKLLTPDILAANKAGALVEATFYSDAKAADILQQSITRLSASYNKLATDANSAIIATNPGVSTMAGNSVIAPGGRSVNPNSPYIGAIGTRAAAHHNPVSAMSKDQKNTQTIHSFTPQPIPVNQKIGAVPQIFSTGNLPEVEGLTTSRGVSTGIVAGEAAKWHALMGTLSMMSKREVADLKKEIARTGTFSADINKTFGQLLPAMTQLTTNAASQSAAVVAQLKAGKINLDAARAKIIAINAELEMLMSQTTSQMATSMGKTANLTQVPLINQPVVSPKGKANIKEIFRAKRPSAQIIDKIARALGVRTYGAGYSNETTIPKMNAGGIVPGTGNTDTYHTTLPEGSFVVNKQATSENMDILGPMMGMNKGGEATGVPVVLTPGEAVIDPYTAQKNIKTLYAINGPGVGGNKLNQGGQFLPATMLWQGSKMNAILAHSSQKGRRESLGLPPGDTIPGKMFADDFMQMRKKGMHPGGLLYEIGTQLGYDKKSLQFAINPMEKEIRTALASAGNITPKQYDQIVSGVIHKHISKVKRFSQAKGRPVSFLEEVATLGFARNEKNKGVKKGSVRNIGFDGQKVAQPFISTGGGIPAESMARSHYAKMQELYPESQRKETPAFGVGKTIKSVFGAERGHVGVGLPFGGMKINPAVRGIHPNNYSINSHGRKAFLGMPLKKLAQGWANPRYIGPDPRSEALTKKWRMGYNRGGMVGGSQASPRGYNAGGMIAQMLLPMLGYMGGQSIGTQLGGSGGGYAGGIIGSMIPSMFMGSMGANRTKTAPGSDEAYEKYGNRVGKSALANNKFSLSLANSAAQGSKVSRVLTTLIGGLTKTNLVVGGVTLALGVGYKAFRDYQEGVRLNVSTFGLTEEAAEKAGLKVTSYNSAIKDSIGTINATIERNKMLYESMNSAGIPIKMTIAEYKKLKEEVKISMSDSIEAINRMKETDLKDYAERLKAQMISAGASADEASKKIYAAFALSEKFALAGSSTLGNMGFNNIKDGITAAIEAYKVFNDTVKNESPDAQGMALTTSLDAVNKAIEESIALSEKKAKADKSGKTVVISRSQAEIEVINKIKSKVSEQTNVSQGLLNSIFDQNKEAKKFLSLQDTALSVMQKLRLQAQGYTGDLSMGALAADRLFSMRAAIESNVTAFSTSQSGPLFGISQKLKTAQEQYKKLGLASQGASAKQQIDARKAGEAIDARIKKIQEEADARRKALTQTLKDEDFLTQVKKKQLEYQDALAAGDMSRAAQAQLDIKSMNKQQQTDKAIQSIDDKEKSDIGKLEAQRKALSDANQKLADSASLAGNGLQRFAKEIEGYQTTISEYNNALTNYLTLLKSNDGKKSMEGPAADFLDKIKNIPGVTLPNKFAGPRPKSSTEMAYEVVSGYSELLKTINTDTAVINVKSAEIDDKSKVPENRNYARGPVGTTGRGASGYIPQIPKTTTYTEKPSYAPGSYFSYTPGSPVKKSMGGLIKMSTVPRMSAGGPVISTVPRYNKGGIVNSSNSSSSSSIKIETISINYPTAPTNAKEFFAQVEEIARQKGIKVLAGGRSV